MRSAMHPVICPADRVAASGQRPVSASRAGPRPCAAEGSAITVVAIVAIAAMLLLLLIAPVDGAEARATGGEHIRGSAHVRDGDSLQIGDAQLRLWGVDAPEWTQTCRRGPRDWACGKAAAHALRERVEGRVLDCLVIDRDRYARRVSRCRLQGLDLNAWLVRSGWALDYRRYSGGAYAAEQREARAARRGVWDSQFIPPEAFRRSEH